MCHDLESLPDVRVFQGQTTKVHHGHGYSSTDEDEEGDEL